MKKTFIIIFIILVVLIAGVGTYWVFYSQKVEYKNTEYGFYFSLPESWKGYSVVTDKWQGYALGGEGNEIADEGPMISLRHPQWTEKTPRQDIPVMIFTLRQWSDLQAEKFHIGAAPIGPSELGRNSKYVFALPARYNYAYLPGFQEIETIIQNKSFTAF